MKHLFKNTSRWLALALVGSLGLVGCGGSTDFNSDSFKVGGTVSGLNSSTSVRLTYGNTANTSLVSQNGSFQFPTALPFNTTYAVTVATQPTNQTCTVTNGSGNARAVVTNVTVNCITNGYSIGGAVSGLDTGTQLTLSNTGGETLVVNANGNFAFTTPVTAYSVAVSKQPTGDKFCAITNGSGVASANVTNVSVACSQVTVLSCGAGKVLTGISGRKGAIIDKLQIRCANLVGSTVDTASTTDGASVGGGGGSDFGSFTCPAGEWVTGVSGGNGGYGWASMMASVQVSCSGGSQSTSYNSGGINPFSYSCTAGKKSTGFIIEGVGAYTGFMQGMTCEP